MPGTDIDRGEMDVTNHKETWDRFTWLLKWAAISCFVLGAIATWMTVVINSGS